MSEAHFQIAYDGEAIKDGTIDVRLLAPALLSLGELFSAANQALNGESATTSLRVESNFRTGSFEVSLLLSQHFGEAVKNLLTSHPSIDAAGLLSAILGLETKVEGAIQGVLKAYKALRGEKPRTTLADQSSRTTIFVLGNGNNVHIEKQTADLYTNPRVLESVDKVLQPLSAPGIDVLEVREQSQVIDRLETADLPQRMLESSTSALSELENPVPH